MAIGKNLQTGGDEPDTMFNEHCHWRGKRVSTLSREELVDALVWSVRKVHEIQDDNAALREEIDGHRHRARRMLGFLTCAGLTGAALAGGTGLVLALVGVDLGPVPLWSASGVLLVFGLIALVGLAR